jgi:hypothetical protein
MNLNQYLHNQFPADLTNLKFIKPNSVIQNNLDSFNIDQYTIYFGGADWENIELDIQTIDNEHFDHFFLCLFTITIIDLTIFTHFNDCYNVFRSYTRYPKFGWSGYGPHYENPKKLLDIPIKKGFLNIDRINLEEYIDLFYDETSLLLKSKLHQVTPEKFFSALLSDKDFQIGENEENSLYSRIILALREKTGC